MTQISLTWVIFFLSLLFLLGEFCYCSSIGANEVSFSVVRRLVMCLFFITVHVQSLDDDLQLHFIGHVAQRSHGHAQLLLRDEAIPITIKHLKRFPNLWGVKRENMNLLKMFNSCASEERLILKSHMTLNFTSLYILLHLHIFKHRHAVGQTSECDKINCRIYKVVDWILSLYVGVITVYFNRNTCSNMHTCDQPIMLHKYNE